MTGGPPVGGCICLLHELLKLIGLQMIAKLFCPGVEKTNARLKNVPVPSSPQVHRLSMQFLAETQILQRIDRHDPTLAGFTHKSSFIGFEQSNLPIPQCERLNTDYKSL